MKDKTIQDILNKLNEGYDELEVWEFSYLDNYITNLRQEIQKKDNVIDKLNKLVEQYSKNNYYYRYNNRYLKSEIIDDLKKILSEIGVINNVNTSN